VFSSRDDPLQLARVWVCANDTRNEAVGVCHAVQKEIEVSYCDAATHACDVRCDVIVLLSCFGAVGGGTQAEPKGEMHTCIFCLSCAVQSIEHGIFHTHR